MEPRLVLAYLESLPVSQGRYSGKNLTLWPWERRLLYGLLRSNTVSCGLTIGRGNGKTTLLSAVAVATIPPGPLWAPRGETVLVASSFEQSRIAFEHCLGFLAPVLDADRRRRKPDREYRVWDSLNSARIEHLPTGARVRCIGSDPRRAHGLAPTLVLADEPAQWPPSTGERMVAALKTAAGKQPYSKFAAVGTRPSDPSHWFARLLDGGADYAQVHACSPADPPFRKRSWVKANPSLPFLPDLESAIRSEAEWARRDPTLLASFEALRLNLGTSDTEVEVLIGSDLWREIEGDAPMSGPCVWGIDLGTSAAQSAVAAFWPETGALAVVAAFPEVPTLEERGRRDGCGGLYKQCHREGSLILCGHRTTDVDRLIEEALSRFGRPVLVCADRWRKAELLDALDRARVPPGQFEARGMGFRDGGADTRMFRRACAEGRVVPQVSLLMRSALQSSRTVTDPAGNSKMVKSSRRAKDDAACAAVLSVAGGVRLSASRRPARRLRSLIV